jgi:tetratricopeptide (TPR) repeat protein
LAVGVIVDVLRCRNFLSAIVQISKYRQQAISYPGVNMSYSNLFRSAYSFSRLRRFAAALLFLLFFVITASAWDKELIEAAKALAKNSANDYQKALIMARNKDLQRISVSSKTDIPDDVYQKCQSWYADQVENIVEAEARKLGLKATKQQSKASHVSPGTDTDIITSATEPGQIKDLKKAVNARFDQATKLYTDKNPSRIPESWVSANDIDLMADASKTTGENFKEISKMNNFAYESPGAARFEAWQRDWQELGKNAPPMRMDELAEYMEEMKNGSARRAERISALKGELQEALKKPGIAVEGSGAWTRVKELQADLHIEKAQQSKLIHRMDEATDVMIKNYPVKGPIQSGSTVARQGKSRDMVSNTAAPDLVNKYNRELIENAYARHAEALAAVAAEHPKMAAQCSDSIRAATANLTESQRREVLKNIKATHGDEVAGKVSDAVLGKPLRGSAEDAGKLITSATGDLASNSTAATRNSGLAGDALEKGRYADAMDAAEELSDNMKRARSLSSISKTQAAGLDEAVDAYRAIKKAAAELPAAERAAYINSKLDDMFKSRGLKSQLTTAIKTASQEAELLRLLAAENNPMRRSIIREMLAGTSTSAIQLWDELRTLSKDLPIGHMMGSLFIYIDAVDAAGRMKEGDIDGALRKAAEGLVGAFGSVGTGLVMVIGNLIIDSAKETGYAIAINQQTLDDLLSGIITVKGWEGAETGELETSITALALKYTTQDEVRKHLKELIEKLSEGSMDKKEITEDKRKALYENMEGKLLEMWREKRMQFLTDYLKSVSTLTMIMEDVKAVTKVEPDPVLMINRRTGVQSGTATLRVMLDGPVEQANDLLLTMEGQLKKLGGTDKNLILTLAQQVKWTLNGKKATDEPENFKFTRVAFEKKIEIATEGIHTFAADVKCELKPVSAITEAADSYENQFDLLAPLRSIKWNYKDGWSCKFAWPGYESVFKPGDIVGSNMKDMERTFTFSDLITFTAIATNLDDSVAVTIKSKPQALPGQIVVLTPVLVSADDINEADFTYKWSGPVRTDGATAFFDSTKPGKYKVGLTLYREQDGKRKKEAEAPPHIIEVLEPSKAQFSVKVTGRSKVFVGEDIDLRATAGTNDSTAALLINDPDIWIEWRINGEVIDTGERVVAEATIPAVYPFEAHLIWNQADGKKDLVSDKLTVEVIDKNTSATENTTEETDPSPPGDQTGEDTAIDTPQADTPPLVPLPEDNQDEADVDTGDQPGDDPRKPKDHNIDSKEIEKDVTKKQEKKPNKATPEPSKLPPTISATPVTTGSGVSGGDVFYGATLQLDFSKGITKQDTSEADKAFLKALSEAGKGFADKYAAERAKEDAQNKAQQKAVEDALKYDHYDRFREAISGDRSSEKATEIGPVNRGVGPADHSNDPVPNPDGPNARFILGDDQGPDPAPPPPPEPKPVAPPPAKEEWRFVFHSSPTLTFNPPESANGKTKVIIDRMGEIKVWAEVHNLSDPKAKPAETPQSTYKVKSPAFTITCTPEGAAVGQEVRATVGTFPSVPANLLNCVWASPASSERMEYSKNAAAIGFTPRDAKPVALKVEARVPHYGDTIGTASASYQPAAFTLTAEVTGRLGPRPMIWSPAQKQLVQAPEKSFAVHEAIGLKATLSGGTVPDKVLWNWTVNSGTTLRSSGLSDSITVARSDPGAITATVTATDKEKRVLGTATVSCSVTITDEQMTPKVEPLKVTLEPAAAKVLTGDSVQIEAAVTGGLAPYTFSWSGVKGRDGAATFTSEKAGSFTINIDVTDQLKKRATATATITVEDPGPTEEELNKQKADELVKAGYELEKREQWLAAIGKYREALKLNNDPRIAERITALEATLKAEEEEKERKARAADLIKKGYGHEQRKEWEKALDCYKEAQELEDDLRVRDRIDYVQNELEKEIARKKAEDEEKERKAQALEWINKGYGFEREKEWAKALEAYTEAQKLDDNDKVRARILYVRRQIEKEKAEIEKEAANKAVAEREAKAMEWINKGYAAEKKEDWQEALDCYKEARKIDNTPKIRERINYIEGRIAQAAILEAEAEAKLKAEEAARLKTEQDNGDISARAAELIKQGYAYEQAAKWSSAIESYTSSLKLEANPKVSERLAYVRQQLKKQNDALQAEQQLARKREADHKEAARKELERREAEKKEAARRETAKREAEQPLNGQA